MIQRKKILLDLENPNVIKNAELLSKLKDELRNIEGVHVDEYYNISYDEENEPMIERIFQEYFPDIKNIVL